MASGGNTSKEKVKEKEEEGVLPTLGVAAAAVGVAAVAWWGISKVFGDSEEKKVFEDSKEKMMKAPGKDYFIPRKDFESNPADWFRNHRSN